MISHHVYVDEIFAHARMRMQGCIELLKRRGVEIKGKRAVVVGRSNIVGMPAAMLLLKLDATVTIVHSRTENPKDIVKQADIIIACAGQAQMVRTGWNSSVFWVEHFGVF